MKEKLCVMLGVFAVGTIAGMAATMKLYERYIYRPLCEFLTQATEESEEQTDGVHDEGTK